jgi:hypothetical protein
MKFLKIGNPGEEAVYNLKRIVRISKGIEEGKPVLKILTNADTVDTFVYSDEAVCQRVFAGLLSQLSRR